MLTQYAHHGWLPIRGPRSLIPMLGVLPLDTMYDERAVKVNTGVLNLFFVAALGATVGAEGTGRFVICNALITLLNVYGNSNNQIKYLVYD